MSHGVVNVPIVILLQVIMNNPINAPRSERNNIRPKSISLDSTPCSFPVASP